LDAVGFVLPAICVAYLVGHRYLNLNVQVYKPHQVSSQYDGHDTEYLSDIVRQAVQQSHRYGTLSFSI